MMDEFEWGVNTLRGFTQALDTEPLLWSKLVVHTEGQGDKNFDNFIQIFPLDKRDRVYNGRQDIICWNN